MISWSIPSIRKRVVIDIDTQRCFLENNLKVQFNKNIKALANIRRIIAWTRLKHIYVVSTIQISSNNGCYCNLRGDEISGLGKINCTLRKRRVKFDATDCTDLPIEILRRYDQAIFCKRCTDPFEEPRADRMLTELEADEFILIGSLAEGAIKATAFGLLARQKNVTVLVDAVLSGNRRAVSLALRCIRARGGKLIETQKILGSSARHSLRG
ncbi:MAG: cysteine hydrolase family protein [Planctomycetota bacterium]|jgi:nicotinamidase-related amidase